VGYLGNNMASDIFALLVLFFASPDITVIVVLEPCYHLTTKQGTKSCVYCYQSFEPVNP